MKIGPIDNTLPPAPVAGERKTATPTGSNASTVSTVAISPEASALASGDGSFDAAKVDRISQSIQDGTYQVNHEAIADKLIANAQELLARTYR
jgi:negative regulator of flagellin synthesis FlgM